MKDYIKNTVSLFAFNFLTIVYFEVLFKIRVLTIAFDSNLLRVLIFSLAYSILIMFIIKFFKEKTVKYIMFISTVIIMFMYFNQEIYSSFVEGFYSLSIAGDFTMGLSFISDYFYALKFIHVFYLIPILALYLLNKYSLIHFKVAYENLKAPLIFLTSFGLVFFIALQTISEEVDAENIDIAYSDMDLYTYMYNSQDALKKFGLLTYTQRDFFSLFRSDPLTESEYDVLLDDFFENKPAHAGNTYTNIFRDKNFILITAESYDTYANNETLTPNLYNLKQNYAYFDNYYSPLYYRSTADTEFLVQTSTYPDKNVTLSMSAYIGNEFPNTMPKLFEQRGYSTFSFHNYTDYFYPRSTFHRETLGYDLYYGSEEFGMLDNPPEGAIINNHVWQSDLEMMEKAVPLFINEDKFFVNILTVSGHFRYNSSHEIAQKHEAEVLQYEADTGIELDEQVFWYLAAQIELDLAIGYLIDQLEENDLMDDTVIMIFGDHYAYGIDKDTIWEYDDIKVDNDDMDIHNIPMLLVSNSYMFDQHIENYMSSVDILPTVSNLFGLNINYKKVFGNDALGNLDNIVHFADMSFISKDFSYDSLSEQYTINDEIITPEYLLSLNHIMINDYMYNVLVLEYDYFRKDEEN